jgi:hypothetical protein
VKVTVQNGATHGLSRVDVERVVQLIPVGWSRLVKSIVLYQGTETGVAVRFYPKEGIIGLFWPAKTAEQPSKSEAVEDLLVALAIVSEQGDLPRRTSASLRARTVSEIADVIELCVMALTENGALK